VVCQFHITRCGWTKDIHLSDGTHGEFRRGQYLHRITNDADRVPVECIFQYRHQKLEFNSPLYTCVLDEKRKLLYISVWGGSSVAVVHSEELVLIKEIAVGHHPSAMASDGSRLFVTNSGENSVSVIDLSTLTVEEKIDVALLPNSPIGSTPNALAFGPGDTTLYVALADNNALAVVDIGTKRASSVKGFIPTGWYPTAIVCADSVLIVANGKGASSGKNFNKENPFDHLKGTISFIPLPTENELNDLTIQVKKNNPYTRVQPFSDWTADNPVPRTPESVSPIKHVFYILKELRTYDDYFGDMKKGNGDSVYAKYGRKAAVNHQALADEFVLLDNFPPKDKRVRAECTGVLLHIRMIMLRRRCRHYTGDEAANMI
jgi:YVTN family beta-propeller protein